MTVNREKMLAAFDHDARRNLRRLASALTALERAGDPGTRARALARIAESGHSLRGVAAIASLSELEHATEDLQRAAQTPDVTAFALRSIETRIRTLINQARADWKSAAVILHVDDDETSRQLLSVLFSQHVGLRLMSAASGAEALEIARAHRPRLVLLDLKLGNERGEDVLRALKADPETRDVPVVIVSAEARPGEIERLLAAGATQFMTKPIDIAAVLQLGLASSAAR